MVTPSVYISLRRKQDIVHVNSDLGYVSSKRSNVVGRVLLFIQDDCDSPEALYHTANPLTSALRFSA